MAARSPVAVAIRRPFPGSELALSELTLDLSSLSQPSLRAQATGVVRRARASGIRSFDVSSAPDPASAEALVRSEFTEPDAAVTVLRRVGEPTRGSVSPVTVPDRRSPYSPATGPLEPPLAGLRYLLEVDPARAAPTQGQTAERTAPPVVPTTPVLRCRDRASVTAARAVPPPRLLAGPFSLLDRSVGPVAQQALGDEPFAWIARDPFAGGRLDGRRFEAATGLGAVAPPRALRELAADVERISRFAFLARPRARSLPQAALHYLTGVPWVATVVVPPPPPERWDEIIGYASSPRLSPSERAEADSVTALEDSGPR